MDSLREKTDKAMMARCIELSRIAVGKGEYPFGTVIALDGQIVAEAINHTVRDGDVTRHAEVVAISLAQKALRSVSLDDCEMFVNAEPCAFCCYAIRESRIRRVVFGLSSPHMGGLSKWNVLADNDLNTSMPDVFAPPPEIVTGFMAKEAQAALIEWNPLFAEVIRRRGLFAAPPQVIMRGVDGADPRSSLRQRALRSLRRNFFDYFGRR